MTSNSPMAAMQSRGRSGDAGACWAGHGLFKGNMQRLVLDRQAVLPLNNWAAATLLETQESCVRLLNNLFKFVHILCKTPTCIGFT